MHTKSDSDVTSVDASSPPRPLYYVQSPSKHDAEKMTYGSRSFGSPHHYHCSPIQHSRESSTSRFSASLKTLTRNVAAWKRLQHHRDEDADGVDEEEGDEYNEDDERENAKIKRFYAVCFVLSFTVLFSIFSLILWAASASYPRNFCQGENIDIQLLPLCSTPMTVMLKSARILYISGKLIYTYLVDISGGKRRSPPKAEKLMEFHSDIVKKAVAKYPEHPLILVGKSMGSRASCMVAGDEDICASVVVCSGYPLKVENLDHLVRRAIAATSAVPDLRVLGVVRTI